jgi:hypothetical protein
MITIGTAIVSYIEPSPGYAQAFNAWYERDHFPATVLAGPGVFGGARYVATRKCKQRRTGTLFGDPEQGSYLAIAWVLPGMQDQWDAWVAEQMNVVAAQNRLFAHREHVHTAVYRFAWERGTIPAINALDHAFAGVVAVATTGDVPRIDAPTVVGLEMERTIRSSAQPPRHTLVLAFGADLEASMPSDVGFASPFLATIPGTDVYTDQL